MKQHRQTVPLKQAVREHQAAHQLQPKQLDHLLAMQTELGVAKPSKAVTVRRPLLAVAGITLAFLLGWLLRSQTPIGPDPGTNPMIAQIADEVAENHLKRKPMEVETGDIEELRAYLQQLDFQPVQPALLASADAALIGGRYCSIQGGIAVQLRVETADGKVRTWYQTRYDRKRLGEIPHRARGEPPIATMARGVPVQIWVEKGLLFAVAGE